MCRYGQKLLLPLLLIIVNGAWADEPSLLVGLDIQADQMKLRYPQEVRETRLSSFVLFWDQPLNSWLDGNITLGVLDISQSGNPIPAGQAMAGNSLGLGLHFHLYATEHLRLHADMHYQYTEATSDLQSQNINIRWHQISGQLQADIRLFQYSSLYLAVGSIAIDGEERATGTINTVLPFNSNSPAYARLGAKIGVDPTGHIGIEVTAGSMVGGRIYFQRWF